MRRVAGLSRGLQRGAISKLCVDWVKRDKLAQVPWGGVSTVLRFILKEFGLFPEDTGEPWKGFKPGCNRIQTKPKLIFSSVEDKYG